MDSIYLSYSGRNCEAVLQVMEGIIARGYALACDCVLPGHEDFDLRVTRAMKAAKAVLAVMTEDAAACPYMQRELALAEALEVPVVTVLVDMAQPPHGFEEPGKLCKVSQYPTKEEIEAVFAAIS